MKKVEKLEKAMKNQEVSDDSDIPPWSMFIPLMERKVCPNCGQFHSTMKLNTAKGVFSVCLRGDIERNLELALENTEYA